MGYILVAKDVVDGVWFARHVDLGDLEVHFYPPHSLVSTALDPGRDIKLGVSVSDIGRAR
jgi:hypothetical protein